MIRTKTPRFSFPFIASHRCVFAS